jgi:hypothetical protein
VRVRILAGYREEIANLDAQERQITRQLAELVNASASTLGELCGLSTVSVAELLVEVGDPRRFTIGGFGRFNGTAPLAASTAEGPGEPIRHRYNPGGNRRVNAILHRMAVTQLRCEPRAKKIYADARANSHTKKEARRILKRHLSDVVYRRMIRDLAAHPAQPLLAAEPRAAAAQSRVARQGLDIDVMSSRRGGRAGGRPSAPNDIDLKARAGNGRAAGDSSKKGPTVTQRYAMGRSGQTRPAHGSMERRSNVDDDRDGT